MPEQWRVCCPAYNELRLGCPLLWWYAKKHLCSEVTGPGQRKAGSHLALDVVCCVWLGLRLCHSTVHWPTVKALAALRML